MTLRLFSNDALVVHMLCSSLVFDYTVVIFTNYTNMFARVILMLLQCVHCLIVQCEYFVSQTKHVLSDLNVLTPL